MSNVRWARIGFSLVCWLFAGLAIVQVYLFGYGAFAPDHNFELPRNVGYLIVVLALVLVVLALAGRMPLRVIGGSALLLGLMVLQVVLASMGTSSPNIAALHPLNGMLIIVVALWQAWRSLGHVRAPLPIEKPRPEPVQAPLPPTPSDKPDPEEGQ